MHRPSRCARIHSLLGPVAAAAGLVGALLHGAPATATQVYHSPNDDGQPAAGPPEIPPGGVQSVYLYFDGGPMASPSGTACDTGTGSEICGYTLKLAGLAGLTLAGFTPDPGADLLHVITPVELRVNGLDTEAPGTGPQRIGELWVNSLPDGSLELTSAEFIGADLSSEILTTGEVVAVPEPGVLPQLLCGAALIGCLGRQRSR